ncbi:MAG: hypothetical protein EA402_04945 [Planctomycetota bacterium]|nr:MAG: hypothetical protein EA402_04945 [Planctomycetota bacterium]
MPHFTIPHVLNAGLLGLLMILANGCYHSLDSHLELKADGSSTLILTAVMERESFDSQLRQFASEPRHGTGPAADFEDFGGHDQGTPAEPAKDSDGAATANTEDGAETAVAAESKDPRQEWNELLAILARDPMEQFELTPESMSLLVTDYDEDSVTVAWTIQFSDLKTLFRTLPDLNNAEDLIRMHLAVDENQPNLLRLELGREGPHDEDHIAMMLAQFPELRMTSRFTFPGAVSQAPGWTIDAENPRHISREFYTGGENPLQHFAAFYPASEVITFAAGDMDITQLPVEYEATPMIQRMASGPEEPAIISPEESAELAASEVSHTLIAQASMLVTTIVHDFPEATEMLRQSGRHFHGDSSHIAISGVLFPPEGRRLVELEEAWVVKAIDDSDKPMALFPRQDQGRRHVSSSFHRGESLTEQSSLSFSLRLPLPEHELEAIEELQARALITTCSEWVTRTIVIDEHSGGAIRLSDMHEDLVLQLRRGASSEDGREETVELMLRSSGPEVGDVRLRLAYSKADRGYSSNIRQDNSREHQGQHQRRVNLRARSWSSEVDSERGDLVLHVEYPKDLQREEVGFLLEALDL